MSILQFIIEGVKSIVESIDRRLNRIEFLVSGVLEIHKGLPELVTQRQRLPYRIFLSFKQNIHIRCDSIQRTRHIRHHADGEIGRDRNGRDRFIMARRSGRTLIDFVHFSTEVLVSGHLVSDIN